MSFFEKSSIFKRIITIFLFIFLIILLLSLSNYLNLIQEIITIIAAVGTICIVFIILYEYFTRPKFVVGVIPDLKYLRLTELYNTSLFDEVIFKPKYLAAKLNRKLVTEKRVFKKIKKKNSIEIENQNGEDQIELYVVLQNIGSREAKDYLFTITFTLEQNLTKSEFCLLDIQTENLDINGLFTLKDTELGAKYKEALAEEKIIKKYKELKLIQQYVSFEDSIESKGFEIVYLKIQVPKELKGFYVVFRIECPGIFYARKIFGQYIKIKRT